MMGEAEAGLALVVQGLATCTKIPETLSSLPSQKLCLIIDVGAIPDDFRDNLKILESRLRWSEEQLNIHGKDVDSTFVEILKKAQSTLHELESEVKKLKEDIDSRKWFLSRWWLYANLYLTSFSDKLDRKFKTVQNDIEEMQILIKKNLESSALMQQSASSQPISTRIYDNGLYVPIQHSQSSVLQAIENPGSGIVLLYGGVGKGKSTLARYICMFYGKDGERTDVFEYVLFVACGGSSKIDPANKQYEILRRLSPNSLDISSESSETTDDKDRTADFEVRTAKSLQNFFMSGKKILIILDDVSDIHFISKMWIAAEGGTQVKYLVTSQYPKLCDNFPKHSVRILMEDPNEQEAKDILASLVGLEKKIIPPNLQGIAGQLIGATGKNPLALAMVASNVAQNKTNVRAWKESYKTLCQTLDKDDTPIVLPGSPESTPPRSLWAAMQICMDSLKSGDAKDILFLMYACKGESVPEEVLRIWHGVAKPSSGTTFSNLIGELRSRGLLKSNASTIASKLNFDSEDRTDQESMSWSLLTTVKLYIGHHMAGKEEMRSIFRALLGDYESKAECSVKKERGSETEEIEEDEEAKVAVALCALYFDRDHTDNFVVEAATRACNASHIDWTATIKDRRRKAIEPFFWLLDQAEEDNLTLEAHCVRQVILRYVRDSELDASNISILLKPTSSPPSKFATLSALADIFDVEEMPLLQNDRLTFLEPLLHIFKANADVQLNIRDAKKIQKIQEAASTALSKIAWKAARENSVESILTSLPALALSGLSYGGGESTDLQISRENGATASLVKALLKDDNPILQANAVGALSNLACGADSIKLQIVSEDATLESLVKSLSKDDNLELQENAALALRNLAVGDEPMQQAQGALKILGKDGALQDMKYASMKVVRELPLTWVPEDTKCQSALEQGFRRFINKVVGSDASGYFVSKVWFLSLDKHHREEVMSVLRGAGYFEIYQTRTTMFYERLDDDMQEEGSDEEDKDSNGEPTTVETNEASIQKNGDALSSGNGIVEEASVLKNAIETSPKTDAKCECPPQVLTVSCTTPTQIQMQPSTSSQGQCKVTIIEKKGWTISTKVDKDISIEQFSLWETSGNRKVGLPLNVSAEACLSCCVTSDHTNLRIDILEIRGEIRIGKPFHRRTNACVLRSVRTNVDALIKNSIANPPRYIFLDIKKDSSYKWRRVLEDWRPDDKNGQRKDAEDLMWLELTGERPEHCRPGSKTLELQYDVRNILKVDIRKGSHKALIPYFEGSPPVTFEGKFPGGLDPNSFLELHVRYQVEISYSKDCDTPSQDDDMFVCTTRENEVVEFDRVLKFATQKLSSQG